MRRVLALDISLKTGWALLEKDEAASKTELPRLLSYGKIHPSMPLKESLSKLGYPWAYVTTAHEMAERMIALIREHKPTEIAAEETCKGRSRFSQKILEQLHCLFLWTLFNNEDLNDIKVFYINTSDWRSNLGQTLTKEDRKSNGMLSKAKRRAELHGEKLNKTTLGIRGRVGKKHLSIRWVNAKYGLNLKMKENDESDAISVGTAYILGCPHSDGIVG
jgi:hypothetical protein